MMVIQNLSLEEKIIESNFILAGEVISYTEKVAPMFDLDLGDLKNELGDIKYTFKIAVERPFQVINAKDANKNIHDFNVIIKGAVSDWNPQCPKIGSKNLFFIRKSPIDKNIYESVSAIYGVYEIDNGEVLGWPRKQMNTNENFGSVVQKIESKINSSCKKK